LIKGGSSEERVKENSGKPVESKRDLERGQASEREESVIRS